MNPELDTLATRLYVTIDDLLIDHPEWRPERPAVGIAPKLTDAELITLAVIQALLGFTSEARFIRHAQTHLTPWFTYLPDRPGYNKRLRHAGQLFQHVIAALTNVCPSATDDLWLVDSTPVECGRSRETTKRSQLAGFAEYGYCASHSRFFWGLRLHLITTPSGLPLAFALTGAKADERDTCLDMIAFSGLDTEGVTPHRRQGLPPRRVRTPTQRGRHHPHPTQPQIRTDPTRPTLPPSIPPNHRVREPNTQSPTRPRTPRRPQPTRRRRAHTPTNPRTDRRHLAQRNHQPSRPRPQPHRLRPLTPWN